MSNYTPKPGTGQLFKNDKKTDDRHPDRKGTALVQCGCCNETFEVEIAGWLKEGRNGPFLSLSIKPKGERPQQQARTQRQEQTEDEGTIPF